MDHDEPLVDPLAVEVSARSQRKSPGRLLRLVGRCLRIVWEADRRSLLLLLVLQVVAAASLAGQVLVVEMLLEAILAVAAGADLVATVWLPVALFAGLTAVAATSGSVQGALGRYLGESVARAMWQDLLRVATGVSLRHFESPEFHDRLQRVQASVFSRPFQVTQGVLRMAGAAVAAVGVGISLLTLSPVLLPLLLLGGVPLLVTSRRESRREFDFTVAETPPSRLRQYLSVILMGRVEAKEIRAFDLAPSLRARFDSLYGQYLGRLARHLRRRAVLNAVGNAGSALVLAGTLFVVVLLISRGDVTVAAAGAAIVAVRILQGQVQTLFAGVQTIFESGLFLDDVDRFLAFGRAAVDEEEGAEPPPFASISARGVRFTYPGSSTPALADVSLSVAAGEVVALVGENGSGKTTLAKILAGLYDADAGAVLWNGVDTRHYARAALRAQVAVIFQDFVRYALTARENIALGRPDAPVDPDRVRRAATVAGVARAIESLPSAYETVLSRLFADGRDLSGGQWQRVAIARAFYRDAPLVILDEPTAALDPRAEHRLFTSLRDVLHGRSAVFISHRFSSVRMADRIYVLSEGRLIEAGSHDELMAVDGHYAELFRLQAAAYLDSTGPSAPTG